MLIQNNRLDYLKLVQRVAVKRLKSYNFIDVIIIINFSEESGY